VACMVALSGCGSGWWDREVDSTGRLIRADVRQAGHEIWQQVRRVVRRKCGDEADAGWLIESAVERISRYLDRKGEPLFSKNVRCLLLTACCRQFRRYTNKLNRLRLVGDISNVPELKVQDDWVIRADGRADLTRILRRLSRRGCTLFVLRLIGFDWREIARALHITEAAARRNFWREIRRVQKVTIRKPLNRERR
jgi:DNA-directed RNA polymerase specialized sigma24 family protein